MRRIFQGRIEVLPHRLGPGEVVSRSHLTTRNRSQRVRVKGGNTSGWREGPSRIVLTARHLVRDKATPLRLSLDLVIVADRSPTKATTG